METFPCPDEDTGLTPQLHERSANLAEHIDQHRKRVLAPESGNTGLTLTGLYNVLAALREGRAEGPPHGRRLLGVQILAHWATRRARYAPCRPRQASTAERIAAMCSGDEPQQAPTMSTPPSRSERACAPTSVGPTVETKLRLIHL